MDRTDIVNRIKELANGDKRVIDSATLIAVADALASGEENAAMQLLEVVEKSPTAAVLIAPFAQEIGKIDEKLAVLNGLDAKFEKLDKSCAPLTRLTEVLEELKKLVESADNSEDLIKLLDEVKTLTAKVGADVQPTITVDLDEKKLVEIVTKSTQNAFANQIKTIAEMLSTSEKNHELFIGNSVVQKIDSLYAQIIEECSVVRSSGQPNTLTIEPKLATTADEKYAEMICNMIDGLTFPVTNTKALRKGGGQAFIDRFGREFGKKKEWEALISAFAQVTPEDLASAEALMRYFDQRNPFPDDIDE
jgi:hypothetical protein